jgi:hypothetical protein
VERRADLRRREGRGAYGRVLSAATITVAKRVATDRADAPALVVVMQVVAGMGAAAGTKAIGLSRRRRNESGVRMNHRSVMGVRSAIQLWAELLATLLSGSFEEKVG